MLTLMLIAGVVLAVARITVKAHRKVSKVYVGTAADIIPQGMYFRSR
jgi:hypothetical protein